MKFLTVLLLAAVPFGTAFVRGRGRLEGGKRLLCAAAVLAGSLAVSAAAWLAMRSGWTHFELLFTDALAGDLLAAFAVPLFAGKRPDFMDVLKALALGCVFTALYSILTYGQAVIDSDTATASLLSASQLAAGNPFPSGWNCANGEIWTLCISTFVLPFEALMRDRTLARMLGSAVFVTAAVLGMRHMSRKGFKNESWVLTVPLFLLFLAGQAEHTLYQAAYTGEMLWVCLFPLLAWEIGNRQAGKLRTGIYLVLSLLLGMCGVRFFADLTLPVFAAWVLTLYLEDREKETAELKADAGRLLRGTLLQWAPALLGFALWILLSRRMAVNDSKSNAMAFAANLGEVWANLGTLVQNLFSCFGYTGKCGVVTAAGLRNLVSLTMCAITVFIVPVLQARRIREEEPFVRFFFAFAMLHNLMMALLCVLFGKLVPHYMLTSCYLFVLVSGRYIFSHWVCCRNFRRAMWTGLFVLAAGIECLVMISWSADWNYVLREEKSMMSDLAARGLTKGYASYWYAYGNEIYSDGQVRMAGVEVSEDGISAHHWLCDDSAFEDCGGRTFVMLAGWEKKKLGDALTAQLGEPEETFTITGAYHPDPEAFGTLSEKLTAGKLYVYVYDRDIAAEL